MQFDTHDDMIAHHKRLLTLMHVAKRSRPIYGAFRLARAVHVAVLGTD